MRSYVRAEEARTFPFLASITRTFVDCVPLSMPKRSVRIDLVSESVSSSTTHLGFLVADETPWRGRPQSEDMKHEDGTQESENLSVPELLSPSSVETIDLSSFRPRGRPQRLTAR